MSYIYKYISIPLTIYSKDIIVFIIYSKDL